MTDTMIEVCLDDAAVRKLLEELQERLEVWREEAKRYDRNEFARMSQNRGRFFSDGGLAGLNGFEIQDSKFKIGRRRFHRAKAQFPFGKRRFSPGKRDGFKSGKKEISPGRRRGRGEEFDDYLDALFKAFGLG